MRTERNISIRGFIVGPIWWPAGAECYKRLSYDLTREDRRFLEPGTLRDHVLSATNDGDFQHATIALGELVIETRKRGAGRETVKRRTWPLSRFPSIADCLHPDGDDWCPSGEDDEHFATAEG